MSIKDTIFSRPRTLTTEAVSTPEWGDIDGKLYVKTLSAKQRDDWEAGIVGEGKKRNLKNIRAKFVVLCVCDEQGALIFLPNDADRLGDEHASVIDRLWEASRKLSGISDEDDEELAKNSSATTDDASPSS